MGFATLCTLSLASLPTLCYSLAASAPTRARDPLTKHFNRLRYVETPSLQREITRLEAEARAQVDDEKARLEGELKAQRQRNKVVANKNKRIAAAIEEFKASCTQLRSEGEVLLRDCERIVVDTESIWKNASVARDFLGEALNESEAALWDAPQVQILAELQQKDEAERSSRQLRATLSSIVPEDASLLQLGTLEAPDDEGAQTILRSLVESVDKFRHAENATFSRVHAAYDEAKAELDAEQANLTANMSSLQATRKEWRDRKGNLTAAVKHLRQVRASLLERSHAIRRYAQRVGDSIPALEPAVDTPAPASEEAESAQAQGFGKIGWSILSKLMGRSQASSLFGSGDAATASP